jgi:nucleoside 2-deoxyribosyltransferase
MQARAKRIRKVYLAGSCGKEHRQIMVSVALAIRNLGFKVYCPFELKVDEKDEYGNWKLSQEDWANIVFKSDISAIDACDIFFMVSAGRFSTAGTNFEEGYAYAKKKKIIVMQYTPDQTSLMTYCGANKFVNTSLECLVADTIRVLTRQICTQPKKYQKCKTYLT